MKDAFDTKRPETGSMKFGDDWRGLFIRGDDAFNFAGQLRRVLELGNVPAIAAHVLRGLLDLLESSDERKAAEGVQKMKAFTECRVTR